MRDFDKLSERQRNILRFMDRYIDEYGFPPTIREIGSATGIESTSVVNYNLNKLVNAGFLERAEAKSRGLRLIKPIPNGRTLTGRVQTTLNVYRIPEFGQIVAGEPINVPDDYYADEDNLIEIPPSLIGNVSPSEVYALKVKGDSMIDAMIQDGDVVILRKANTAMNGEMVAVWLTDRSETTLKHFYDEGGRIRLQPAHPTMSPIFVDPRHCQVQGKVLSVMRRLK
ncbi:MAG: transcriptional repressor LexA [Anaerolineae bacterium]